jgi:hypothetical protein
MSIIQPIADTGKRIIGQGQSIQEKVTPRRFLSLQMATPTIWTVSERPQREQVILGIRKGAKQVESR